MNLAILKSWFLKFIAIFGIFVIVFCPCVTIMLIQLLTRKILTQGAVEDVPATVTTILLIFSLITMLGYIGMVYGKKYLGWAVKPFEKLSKFTNLFWYKENDPPKEFFKKNSIVIYLWFLCWWGNLYYFLVYWKVETFHGLGNFLDGIYFSFITAFTIGYGDFYPCTWIGKLLVIVEIFFNFLFLIAIFQKVYSDTVDQKA